MKKRVKILIALFLIDIALLGLLYAKTHYTQKDKERVEEIYLGIVKPNKFDYIKLDVDKNGKFTLYDSVLIVEKLEGK